jgi:WD40 repeat protein
MMKITKKSELATGEALRGAAAPTKRDRSPTKRFEVLLRKTTERGSQGAQTRESLPAHDPSPAWILSILTAVTILLGLPICLAWQAQASPNEEKFLAIESKQLHRGTANSVQTSSISAAQPWRKVRLIHSLEETTTVQSLVFSPDGKTLITGGGRNDPQMRLWSVETGENLSQVRAQRTAISALAISPNGKTLVSGGEDAGINFWDWQTGEYQAIILDHDGSITSLAIAPNSKFLVSGSLDGIRVWDLLAHPQRPLYTLADLGNPTQAIAIHPNGDILASGDINGTVKLWNLPTGTMISQFSPHAAKISGLAFTPDGNTLITASYDGKIEMWDLASGQLLQTLTGHSGIIRVIALHPNGQILASGGNDGVILWDLQTGELLTKLKDHHNWIQSLAFSRHSAGCHHR